MKEIKEDLNERRVSPYTWIGRLNIVKMSILPNLIYRVNEIPIKLPESYFVGMDEPILNFTCKGKRPKIVNTILKEKNKVGVLTLPNSRLFTKL